MERFQLQVNREKQKGESDFEDRISHLPDDVLVSILSCMPTKVAARTSLLSRQWRMVWTLLPRLEFDASDTIHNIKKVDRIIDRITLEKIVNLLVELYPRPVIEEFRKVYLTVDCTTYLSLIVAETIRLVNTVNHLVELYPLPVIEEFRVCFHLDRGHKHGIDKWVKFVFEKKTKRLKLDFAPIIGLYHVKCFLYILCPPSLGLQSYIPLTSLVLRCVNVSDEVLDNFVSNSPFLEHLCVQHSMILVHVRVAGPSLHLRSLEISCCSNVESIELDAINLASFKYTGPQIEIPLEKVPNLKALCIGDEWFCPFDWKFPKILTLFPQLQKLGLHVSVEAEAKRPYTEFPRMSQLKEMALCICTIHDLDSLLFLSWWVDACPSLHRFALDLEWKVHNRRRTKKGRRSVHHSLKEVEITGFVGETVDTELCIFFIENAITLEKMVLDPIRLFKRGVVLDFRYFNIREYLVARQRAEHLFLEYNLGDKLVIR